jgi:hypothetical protein
MSNHRTALLIIRAWVEVGSEQPLRAQVNVTGDISTGMERTVTLTQPEALHALLDTWLHDVLGEMPSPSIAHRD